MLYALAGGRSSIWVICHIYWEQLASLFVLGGLGSIYFIFLDCLFFCIFPDLGSGFLTCAHCEDAVDLVFTSSEQSGTVFTVPCGDYSVEQSINWRHLHSALQPAGELRGRLWNGGKRG